MIGYEWKYNLSSLDNSWKSMENFMNFYKNIINIKDTKVINLYIKFYNFFMENFKCVLINFICNKY